MQFDNRFREGSGLKQKEGPVGPLTRYENLTVVSLQESPLVSWIFGPSASTLLSNLRFCPIQSIVDHALSQ